MSKQISVGNYYVNYEEGFERIFCIPTRLRVTIRINKTRSSGYVKTI